ncbi:YihY family inner membrane protein [Herminiimonas sp. CN]|uniref:YihY family inner membrane protein n=1 Tax=Herminiimonas sp. CN TaxID=1349818 RepID=UPI0004741801|nr:YihY family inner membrane protein [Herminiimonas sp. CN]
MPLKNLSILRGMSWSDLRNLFRFARNRLHEERLSQVAGSLTYTTVLALVPILTIALAIFTTFPLFNTFRAALESYLAGSLIPSSISNTILGYLTQFATKAKSLSAAGAVLLIVTAVLMMMTVDRTLNDIWRVRTQRPFAQRVTVYWAVVTLGPLLIGVSMTLTSYLFTATSGVVASVPFIGAVFYTLVSILFTTGAFTLLYVMVPNRPVDWRDAAWGGLVAAIAFEIVKRLFAGFVSQSPTYTLVYGAVAAIPIFLLWIYLCWLITLSGAVLAASLPIVKYERWWHVAAPGSAFVDAMAVIEVLYRARVSGGTAVVDTLTIRRQTRLGFEEIERLLQAMHDANWVGRVKPDQAKGARWGRRSAEGFDNWVLVANPQQLALADVYRMFVFDPAGDAALARQVETAVEQGLGETLAEHFSKSES